LISINMAFLNTTVMNEVSRILRCGAKIQRASLFVVIYHEPTEKNLQKLSRYMNDIVMRLIRLSDMSLILIDRDGVREHFRRSGLSLLSPMIISGSLW
jgi:hypothetical protein